jgi:hypothetical protein
MEFNHILRNNQSKIQVYFDIIAKKPYHDGSYGYPAGEYYQKLISV